MKNACFTLAFLAAALAIGWPPAGAAQHPAVVVNDNSGLGRLEWRTASEILHPDGSVGSSVDHSWSLPAKIAFVGYNGVSTGEVQQALGPWRNVCQSSLPSISYGGNPDHYSSDTEIWTVHKGTAAEIGMVNDNACGEANIRAKNIRLPTVSG